MHFMDVGGKVVRSHNQVTRLSDKNDVLFIRRKNTLFKQEHIKSAGCNLVVMWECQYRQLLKSDIEMQELVVNHPTLKQ